MVDHQSNPLTVILSMHSSGSSLLTGMLARNGFNVGDTRFHIEPEKHNAKGFYELKSVIEINEEIIRLQSKGHLCPIGFDSSKKLPSNLAKRLGDVARLLKSEGINLVKDPRFCLTWTYWEKHFPDASFIVLYRNPIDVARSLQNRQKFPFSAGLALWEYYYRVLPNSILINAEYVDFQTVIERPTETLDRLLKYKHHTSPDPVDPSFLDLKLISQQGGLRNDSDLSIGQSEVWLGLTGKKLQGLSIEKSAACHSVLLLLAELIDSGFQPANGRLIDKLAIAEIKHYRGLAAHRLIATKNLCVQAKKALDSRGVRFVEKMNMCRDRIKGSTNINSITILRKSIIDKLKDFD